MCCLIHISRDRGSRKWGNVEMKISTGNLKKPSTTLPNTKHDKVARDRHRNEYLSQVHLYNIKKSVPNAENALCPLKGQPVIDV
jgi:hypothetical protein